MANAGADTAAAAAAGAAHAQHQDETRLILLPVDLDDASITAVTWAAKHVLRKGDTALLLHVIPATYPTLEPALGLGGEGVFANVPDPEAEALRREAAERFINGKLEPLLKSLPGVSVRHAVLRFATDADSVGRVVCTNAEELGAAMVVIPSHGKGRLREMFLGSTSNYCTHHCKAPVVVLR